MIETPLVTIERTVGVVGETGKTFSDLVTAVLEKAGTIENAGGVVAATFSNPDRFPSLAVRVASALSLPKETPALDLQMACSSYPYALYVAAGLSAGTGKRILVVNGDLQTSLVDTNDHATGGIFSDAMTISVVSCDPKCHEKSFFGFLSRFDDALTCGAKGPIRMDGMKVFSFVATDVRKFLSEFPKPDFFVPHQANPYIIRQLAKSLGLQDRLLTLDASVKNPGGCSIPLTLASLRERFSSQGNKVLLAGFGAGFSAGAAIVRVL